MCPLFSVATPSLPYVDLSWVSWLPEYELGLVLSWLSVSSLCNSSSSSESSSHLSLSFCSSASLVPSLGKNLRSLCALKSGSYHTVSNGLGHPREPLCIKPRNERNGFLSFLSKYGGRCCFIHFFPCLFLSFLWKWRGPQILHFLHFLHFFHFIEGAGYLKSFISFISFRVWALKSFISFISFISLRVWVASNPWFTWFLSFFSFLWGFGWPQILDFFHFFHFFEGAGYVKSFKSFISFISFRVWVASNPSFLSFLWGWG